VAGFGSCLALPLHTGETPAGVVALYADDPNALSGAAHDIALLFAAQGGTALHNADVYGACREMVGNLQKALASRAVLEQAKGLLRAELGVSPEEAFKLIGRTSQNTDQKAREVAAKLIRGEITAHQLRRGQRSRGTGGPDRPPHS
jgi:GAF domain-containing protein